MGTLVPLLVLLIEKKVGPNFMSLHSRNEKGLNYLVKGIRYLWGCPMTVKKVLDSRIKIQGLDFHSC